MRLSRTGAKCVVDPEVNEPRGAVNWIACLPENSAHLPTTQIATTWLTCMRNTLVGQYACRLVDSQDSAWNVQSGQRLYRS
jgi:hypothetical protein